MRKAQPPDTDQRAATGGVGQRLIWQKSGLVLLSCLLWLFALSACYSPLLPKCAVDNECGTGQVCFNGSCQCPPNTTSCLGGCYNLSSDIRHCGKCGNPCPGLQLCQQGTCIDGTPPPTCDAPKQQCGTTCVDLQSSPQHCGKCDNACPNGQFCCQGRCSSQATPQPEECNGQDDDCDGQVDEDCPTGACKDGSTRACYTGPSVTRSIGECKDGTQLCSGEMWGPCKGDILPQAPDCQGTTDKDCDGQIDPACPSDPWHQTTGTKGTEYGIDVIADKRGNVYVRGYSDNPIKIKQTTYTPSGENRIFVLKLDGTGEPQWIVAAGKIPGDEIYGSMSIAANGDLLVSGNYNGTLTWPKKQLNSLGKHSVYLARFSSDGALKWAVSVNTPNDIFVGGHTSDADGKIYLTGAYQGPLKIDNDLHDNQGGRDVFLTAYNPDGTYLWSHVLQSRSNVFVWKPYADPTGKAAVYLGGSFQHDLITGKHKVSSLGNTDVYLARFTLAGECTWLRSVGGSSSEYIIGLRPTTAGIMVAGEFRGTAAFGNHTIKATDNNDIFVIRFDDKGDVQWARSAKAPGDTPLYDVDFSADGATYMLGRFVTSLNIEGKKLAGPFIPTVFVAALDTDGQHLWSQRITQQSEGAIYAYELTADSQGRVTIGGLFVGTFDFAGTRKQSSAKLDLFAAHFSAQGAIQWLLTVGERNTERFGNVFAGPRDLVYITGGYDLQPSIDNQTLPNRGNADLLVIKRKP